MQTLAFAWILCKYIEMQILALARILFVNIKNRQRLAFVWIYCINIKYADIALKMGPRNILCQTIKPRDLTLWESYNIQSTKTTWPTSKITYLSLSTDW